MGVLIGILNISGILSHKFQSISLMPFTLTDNPHLMAKKCLYILMIGLFRSNNKMVIFSKTENLYTTNM